MVHGKTKGRKLAFLDCGRFNLHSDDALQGTGNHIIAVSCFYDNGGNGLFRMAETGEEIIFKKIYYLIQFIFSLYLLPKFIGADRFRQQDQWVNKHAENRSAISLIPCYKF